MASIGKYNIDTAFTSFVTTGLNSLTTGSATASSSAITNGTSLALLMDISLNLGSFNPSGTPYLEIHLLPLSGDGSTYADQSAQTLVATIQVTTGASAKVAVAIGIPVQPGDFKLQVKNVTGATLAASANTGYYRLYDYNLNG